MTKFDRTKIKGKIAEIYGTQEAFSQRLGTAGSTISLILVGKNNPNSDTIFAWAQALNLRPEEIGEYFFTPEK